jgi:dienelactone hydrolase
MLSGVELRAARPAAPCRALRASRRRCAATQRRAATACAPPEPPSLGRRAATAGGVLLGGAAAFRLGAAVTLAGAPRFPPLGGRFAVAGLDLRLPSTGVRARLLYPCDPSASAPALAYMGSPVADEGKAQAASLAGLVRFPAWLTTHLADGASGVLAGGAAVPIAPGRFPSLAYSHGFGGNAQMGTRVLAEIASHGVVVLAVEHTDGSASRTLRADGSVLRFGERPAGGRGAGLALRAVELRGAAAALAGGADAESLPAQVLAACDPASAFLGGHSYGAPTALLALRSGRDPPFAGVLLHDAALQMSQGLLSSPESAASSTPRLFLMSDEYAASDAAREPVLAATRAAPPGSGAYLLRGAAHGNYVDAPYVRGPVMPRSTLCADASSLLLSQWAPSFVMRGLARLGIPAAGAGDAGEVLRVIGESGAAFLRGADTGRPGFAGEQPLLQPLALTPRTA